jgi:hypothetical protein
MRKIILVLIFSVLFLQADETIQVNDFEVSLFSKLSKKPVQVETSLIFEGRDVEVYDFKIIDSLNVVIGSFYAENLLTSQGKEGLKKALINYNRDKYSIDIDNIYIQKLNIKKDISNDDIIDLMKQNGCCAK